MPETLTATGPGYTPHLRARSKSADEVARAASAVMRAELPPEVADTVPPFVGASARHVAGVDLLGAWVKFCTHTVDTAGADLRPEDIATWLDLTRQMVRTLVTGLELAESVEDRSEIARAAAADIRAQLPTLERLASDLAACRTNDDLRALAVQHYPLDMEAFAQQVKTHPFVPTQAMLDEDWSHLIPKKGG